MTETKNLTLPAQETLDAYARMKVGDAIISAPYFNNKTRRARMALRVHIGKGSPRELREELEALMVKKHISRTAAPADVLTKLMVDAGLGIDCSAFAYYILDAESRARGYGHLNRRINFIKRYGPVGKMMCYLRPAENCDVKTFASDTNTRAVDLGAVKPADMVTMTDGPDGDDRNHILVITSVDYEDGQPKRLRYAHAIAYPEDGLYHTGVKEGVIDIAIPGAPLADQIWSESGSTDKAAAIFARARASRTELRRLKWLS